MNRWGLAPNMFSDWGSVGEPDDFDDAAAKRLEALKEKVNWPPGIS